MQVDLDRLGFDEGGHLLVKRALRCGSVGEEIIVTGSAPELESHLRAWCRRRDIVPLAPDSSPHSRCHHRTAEGGGPAPSVLAAQALLNLMPW